MGFARRVRDFLLPRDDFCLANINENIKNDIDNMRNDQLNQLIFRDNIFFSR